MKLFGPAGTSTTSCALRLKYPNDRLNVPSALRYQPSKAGVTVCPDALSGASGRCAAATLPDKANSANIIETNIDANRVFNSADPANGTGTRIIVGMAASSTQIHARREEPQPD